MKPLKTTFVVCIAMFTLHSGDEKRTYWGLGSDGWWTAVFAVLLMWGLMLQKINCMKITEKYVQSC